MDIDNLINKFEQGLKLQRYSPVVFTPQNYTNKTKKVRVLKLEPI
jgi:hypothetical protein